MTKLLTWPYITPEYLESQGLSPTTPERFFSKIAINPVTDCWDWLAMIHNGYGYMARGFNLCKPVAAYRVAWIMCRGPIPDGVEIRHLCPCGPNKRCCNPAHMELGTHAENMGDEKGEKWHKDHPEETQYFKKGEKSPFAKLTKEQGKQILKLYNGGKGIKQIPLAKMFKVSQATIWNVIHGITLSE